MPAPSSATYSVAALVAANIAFRDLLDAGSGPGDIAIRDDDDVLLAVIPLTDPSGSVNESTGQLAITPDGRDESAPAAGTAAYAEMRDSDGVAHLALPCQAGTEAVPGVCVLDSLAIEEGSPVEIASVVIG